MKKNIWIAIGIMCMTASIVGGIVILNKKEKEEIKAPISSENDYYSNQMKKMKESILYEEQEEKESREMLGEEDPYLINFYSDKLEILDVKTINYDSTFGSITSSASMMLDYYGINMKPEELENKYLPITNVLEKNGQIYGVNPTEYCIKKQEENLSCFSKVVEESLQKVVGENKLILSLNGQNLNYIISYIPAMIWVGENYQESNEVYEWINEEKNEKYTSPKKAHTVLLIGYDKNNFYIKDPLKKEEVIKIEREVLEKSYNSYGRQGLAIWKGQTGLFK